jgi:hypothetical protein
MFGRFDPATELLHTAITEGRYGTLKTLSMELCTALLWEGYQIGLDSLAMDVLHSSLDAIVTALGRPESMAALGVAKDPAASAAEVLLGYPSAIVRCGASALLPAQALWDARRLPGRVHRRGHREQLDRGLRRPPHRHADRVHRAGPARG